MKYKSTIALLQMPSPIVNNMTVAEALVNGHSLVEQAQHLNNLSLSKLRIQCGDKYPVSDKMVMEDVINALSPYLSDERLFQLNEALCKSECHIKSQQAFRTSTFARFFMYAEMRRELKVLSKDELPSRFLYHYKNSIRPSLANHFEGNPKNEQTFLYFNFFKIVELADIGSIMDTNKVEKPRLSMNAKPIQNLVIELELAKKALEESGAPSKTQSTSSQQSAAQNKHQFFHSTLTAKFSNPKSFQKKSNTPEQHLTLTDMIHDLENKKNLLQKLYAELNSQAKEFYAAKLTNECDHSPSTNEDDTLRQYESKLADCLSVPNSLCTIDTQIEHLKEKQNASPEKPQAMQQTGLKMLSVKN